jgi:hypothetical protein
MPNLIGNAANQVSTNGMLGTAAFIDISQLPNLTLISTGAINAVSTLNITNIPTYKRLLVIVDNNTFPSSDQVLFKLSVDNGSTFPGFVCSVSVTATTPTVTPVYIEVLSISLVKRVISSSSTGTASTISVETNAAVNAAAVNAIRLYSNNGQNFTGATYYIYGEN